MTKDEKRLLCQPVRDLRAAIGSGLTQPEFGKLIGQTAQTVWKYEDSGPVVESLPNLALVAHQVGRGDLANLFFAAFLREFPALLELLTLAGGTPVLKVDAHQPKPVDALGVNAVKRDTDLRKTEIIRLIDRIIELKGEQGADAMVTILQQLALVSSL